MKGCVFEKKKKKTRIRTRKELRMTFHKVKKVVFVTYAVIKTGAESRFCKRSLYPPQKISEIDLFRCTYYKIIN